MRAKENKMSWYFDIVNPVLAEFCRKNKVDVYTSGNLVHSKGNMPDSIGSSRVREPRIVESRKIGSGPNTPNGGSISRWFVDMGKCAGILNDKIAQNIMAIANLIDSYTYFYEIEYVHISPYTFDSFISIEKRLYNECKHYGFTEEQFEEYRKERRKGDVSKDLRFFICDDSEKAPLCERLNEGVGMRQPTKVGGCEFELELTSPYVFGGDAFRNMMAEATGEIIPVSRKCVIPHIESSDTLSDQFSGVHYSITSVSGKAKNAIVECIKRNGGKTATEYSPKTTVFITKNISEQEFFSENAKRLGYEARIVVNSALNGLARKALGENVQLVLEQDFISAFCKKETKEEFNDATTSQDLCFNENGDLVMTMAQAESLWTVKTGRVGYTISGYKGSEETLYLPAYIDGIPVTTVNRGKKNGTVKKVIVPSTIKKINAGAFVNHTQLEKIEIKGGEKTEVAVGAISNCPLIYDANGCFIIGDQLIDCRHDGEVTIPGIIKEIYWDFASATGLKNSKIKKIIIEEGVEETGSFMECKSLETVVFPSTVKRVGGFLLCPSLTTVNISEGCKYISSSAFKSCKTLTNVIIPSSVTVIEHDAFGYCESLSRIIIPASVIEIERYAFEGCKSLTIYCEAINPPKGWDPKWNSSKCPVVWGYKATKEAGE